MQAGLEGETDCAIVRRLSGLKATRILPETYRLADAASPHLAAELDDIDIEPAQLLPPSCRRPLVIEGAGGLMVPLTRKFLHVDLFAAVAASGRSLCPTALGTINHTLLSIEALERRAIPILGIAFIGDENVDTERTIAEFGGVKHLGRLPWLDPLDARRCAIAFAAELLDSRISRIGATAHEFARLASFHAARP